MIAGCMAGRTGQARQAGSVTETTIMAGEPPKPCESLRAIAAGLRARGIPTAAAGGQRCKFRV